MDKRMENRLWLKKIGNTMRISSLSYQGDNKWEMEIIQQKDGKTKPVCMEMITVSCGKHYLIFSSDGNGDGEEFLTTREFYKVVKILEKMKVPPEMQSSAMKAQIQMDTNRTVGDDLYFKDLKRYLINWQPYFRIRPSFED